MTQQLTVQSPSGARGGKLEVSDAVFGGAFNEPLVHQVVVAYHAGARAGTRAQKNRSAVSGGGAKPWRQKGSGRARAGTIRSPLFRGGGVAFPAQNADFSQKVNRKMYRAAMRSILSELNRLQRLIVIDRLGLEAPSSKTLAATLRALDAERALLIVVDADRNVELSARNLVGVSVCESARIDPVALISHDKIVATADALQKINEALQ